MAGNEDTAREHCSPEYFERFTRQASPLLAPAGAPATVTVYSETVPCQEKRKPPFTPDTVTAEVHGPGNTLIPSDIQLDPWMRHPLTATLRFTPPVPGAYQVRISFAPVGGSQQFILLAGRDRTQTPVVAELNRYECRHLDRTSRGTWICDNHVLRPGDAWWRTFASPPAGANFKLAVAGDVVWVTEPGAAWRYVDTGTSLQLTGVVRPPEGLGDTWARLATEEELVLLDTARITRITFTQGQGLTAWPAFRLPEQTRYSFDEDFTQGLLLRSGERLLWVSASLTPAVEFVSSVCPLRLGAEGGFVADELPCQTVPGMPIGSEPGVLWLRTGELRPGGSDPRFTMDVLTRWVVRDGRLVEAGALRLRDAASTLRGRLSYGPVVPTLASGLTPYAALPGWRPAPGELEPGLELELFPASLGPRANPRFFWNNLSGTVRVFAR